MSDQQTVTLDNLAQILEKDVAVKVAGADVDGILRGKLMAKSKFLQIAEKGFGFCSVIFGWDLHDQPYTKELLISNKENGYRDLLAIPDLTSFRRIPWENNVPLFLLSFHDPDTGNSVSACPRSALRRIVDKVAEKDIGAMAGAEYEFWQFKAPKSQNLDSNDRDPSAAARFLQSNPPEKLPHLTEGMFGYSLTDTARNKDWFYHVYEAAEQFNCPIEGWHTETGPGVYEAALCYTDAAEMADKAALFKFLVKNIGSLHGITSSFMAKPRQGLPGNSGHMHISLASKSSKSNLFARDSPDPDPPYSDLTHLSDVGRHFLAGLIEGLPDIMPLFAPTINSYKRLVENFWAPVTVSWGFEHRAASIRIIGPPSSSSKATRFEVRVPGADTNPYLALAAILGCGWRGVEKKLEIKLPPLGKGQDMGGEGDKGARLAKSLKEATERFRRKDSVAREVFGDEFVDHYAGTRDHECTLWDEAVTDWEVRRYIEMV